MARDIKRYTDFLVRLGTDEVPHTGGPFLAHLIAVYRDLESWGCEEPVCLGGMFHSIYGTETFQRFSLPLERRGEVRDLIGERAERLGYLNAAMVRESFDSILEGSGLLRMVDRFTREELALSQQEFENLCEIHLCDWLEQVPRSKNWSYRRDAYGRMAAHLGGVAREAHDRVYALSSSDA